MRCLFLQNKANFLPKSLGLLFWKRIASLRLDNESLKRAQSIVVALFLSPVNVQSNNVSAVMASSHCVSLKYRFF